MFNAPTGGYAGPGVGAATFVTAPGIGSQEARDTLITFGLSLVMPGYSLEWSSCCGEGRLDCCFVPSETGNPSRTPKLFQLQPPLPRSRAPKADIQFVPEQIPPVARDEANFWATSLLRYSESTCSLKGAVLFTLSRSRFVVEPVRLPVVIASGPLWPPQPVGQTKARSAEGLRLVDTPRII